MTWIGQNLCRRAFNRLQRAIKGAVPPKPPGAKVFWPAARARFFSKKRFLLSYGPLEANEYGRFIPQNVSLGGVCLTQTLNFTKIVPQNENPCFFCFISELNLV
jgi:hypothetical protein